MTSACFFVLAVIKYCKLNVNDAPVSERADFLYEYFYYDERSYSSAMKNKTAQIFEFRFVHQHFDRKETKEHNTYLFDCVQFENPNMPAYGADHASELITIHMADIDGHLININRIAKE